jgi:amino acid transporter
MKVFKSIADIGGVGNVLPGIIIIVLAFVSIVILRHHIPTDYSLSAFIPKLDSTSNIAFLSTLMFSMAGIEITPILAGETVNPQKTFPRAILISVVSIVGIYIIATVAMTFILPPSEIGTSSGIMDVLSSITTKFHMSFVMFIVAGLIVISGVGGMSVWMIAPIKMFFESTKEGILPPYFTKLNKKGLPAHALLIQATIVTLVIILTSFLPSVNVFYATLLLMATITYFIPYIAMFLAFLKLRKKCPNQVRPYKVPGGMSLSYLISGFGLLSVILAIVLPFISPPSDIVSFRDTLIYRLELSCGPILFFIIGYWLYTRYERKQAAGNAGK